MHPAAIAFMLGDTSPEVLAELRAAMVRWSEQTGAAVGLNRCVGLGTPRAVRRAMRNALLVEAAAPLPGSHWRRCQWLAARARAFNVRRWPTWRRVGIPSDASDLDVLLFRACELGEALPETPEAYLSILPEPV